MGLRSTKRVKLIRIAGVACGSAAMAAMAFLGLLESGLVHPPGHVAPFFTEGKLLGAISFILGTALLLFKKKTSRASTPPLTIKKPAPWLFSRVLRFLLSTEIFNNVA